MFIDYFLSIGMFYFLKSLVMFFCFFQFLTVFRSLNFFSFTFISWSYTFHLIGVNTGPFTVNFILLCEVWVGGPFDKYKLLYPLYLEHVSVGRPLSFLPMLV